MYTNMFDLIRINIFHLYYFYASCTMFYLFENLFLN